MNIEIAPKETETQTTWYNAQMYCLFLNVGGKTDWRLPTKDELNDIYNAENDFVGSFYWSATEGNGYLAWCQGFSDGLQYSYFHKKVSLYVRAIRDIT